MCLSRLPIQNTAELPFINIPPEMAARQLCQDRPFLFQAIITVASFSTRERLMRAEELKRLVFTSALTDAQSSMDMLLGLLTYIAWSTDAFLGRADPPLSRLMMLAISLMVYDLRLFKPSPPDVRTIVAFTQGFYEHDRTNSTEAFQSLMDQQRAVLACFVLAEFQVSKPVAARHA